MKKQYGIRISELIIKCSLVALVEVQSVKKNGLSAKVKKVEVYKGQMPDTTHVRSPAMWSKYDCAWFQKGEMAVIFALQSSSFCPDEIVTFSIAGRMPLKKEGKRTVAISFVNDASYMEELSPDYHEDTCSVDWGVFRHFLHRTQMNPRANQ